MARILPETFRHACKVLVDAALPASCLLCGDDADDSLCSACSGDLPRLGMSCPQCAEPTTHGERCGRCLAHPPHFDAATALFAYAFPVDRLIHLYKYGGQLALGRWLAQALVPKLRETHCDCVIPMPLHPARLRERGFNQAVEMARVVTDDLSLALDLNHFWRRVATSSQADLPYKKRAANVKNAFECTADFSGRRILLIDDVMTTGATVNECARTLKLHGAIEVQVAVVARAMRQ